MVDADLGFREMSTGSMQSTRCPAETSSPVNLRINYYDVGDDCVSLATDPVTITYIGLASDAGINVIVPAGDSGCNIETRLQRPPFRKSRTASSWARTALAFSDGGPVTTRKRRSENHPPRVEVKRPLLPDLTCASWGGPLVTTGGNLNLTQVAIDTVPDTPGGDPEGYISLDQRRRSYTSDFGNRVQDGGSMAPRR